jgi:hypothetical protein
MSTTAARPLFFAKHAWFGSEASAKILQTAGTSITGWVYLQHEQCCSDRLREFTFLTIVRATQSHLRTRLWSICIEHKSHPVTPD